MAGRVGIRVTDNKVHDIWCAIGLIETTINRAKTAGCKVKQVIANAGHGIHEIFRHSGEKNRASEKVRRDTTITDNGSRDEVVREMGK